jgi:hypothetical protein
MKYIYFIESVSVNATAPLSWTGEGWGVGAGRVPWATVNCSSVLYWALRNPYLSSVAVYRYLRKLNGWCTIIWTIYVNTSQEQSVCVVMCKHIFNVIAFPIQFRSRGSSGCIESDYGLDDRAIEVRSPTAAEDFSSSPDRLGPTQPPIQWVPGVLYPGVKRGRGVTLTTHPHLVPRLSMRRSYTSSPPMRLHGM